MKTLLLLLVLAVAGIYGAAALTLSESRANRFLDELEDLSIQGNADEYCARLDEAMVVSIHDHSADAEADIEGGKKEFCDYVSMAAKGMSLLGVSTHVQRNHFTVHRSWLHPWTIEVSYDEQRTTQMSRLNFTLHTRSNDRLTLVQTFRGMRLAHIESEVWKVN